MRKLDASGEASLRRNMQVPQCELVPRGDEGIAPYACWVDAVEGIGVGAGASPRPTMWQEESGSVGVDACCCGAQNFLLAYAHQILTAATPCCSLHPPPAVLATVPSTRAGTIDMAKIRWFLHGNPL